MMAKSSNEQATLNAKGLLGFEWHQSTTDTRGHEHTINIVTADESQHRELNNQLLLETRGR